MNYSDRPSPTKEENNRAIIEFVKTYLGRSLGSVLTLDAERLGFTRLVLNELNPNYIILPQLDLNTCNLMIKSTKSLCSKKCLVYCQSLELVLHYLYDYGTPIFNDINVVYFDYTGNIEGNKSLNLFPLEDIDFFLNNTPQTRIIMALTVTGALKELYVDQPPKMSLEYNEENFLLPAFQCRQWVVGACWKRRYKREAQHAMTMDFYLYYLIFDPSVDYDVTSVKSHGHYTGYRDAKAKRVFMRRKEEFLNSLGIKFY